VSSTTQAVALAEPAATAAADVPELLFVSGLPGFPGQRRFALVRWGAPDGPYSLMVDLDDSDVRFLVMPPYVFFPDYVVDLDDAIAAKVHLERPEDCLLLVIVTLGTTPADATANLLGPVVINLRTREGVQAVLAESGHSTRVPLRAS
jgi:flagellar assembly factor FliW